MNKEQREQLASDLLAEAEHRRGRVVDLLRNAAAALSAPNDQQARQPGQVVWVNPEEFDLCQTKPIIMDEHNELLNGMPRQIAALAARTDHCSLALMPATPPAAQVQGEQPDRYQSPAYCQGLEQERDYLRAQLKIARKGFPGMVELAGEIAQLRAALSAPPATATSIQLDVRRCQKCGHVGVNDSLDGHAACHNCDWNGPEPDIDHCPECQDNNCMGAACPQCHGLYELLAETAIDAPPAAGVPEGWQPMETAPKDGTLLRLLVEFEDHPIDDGAGPFATVGTNYRDNTGEDIWQIVGWCWEQDRFIDGVGTPIGWLPMLAAAPTPPASEQQRAVVMPERIRAGSERGIDDPGFNAALDELLRLNPHLAKGEGV